MAVMASIDRMAWDFGNHYHPESADTSKYILKDVLICIIKEQCSDQKGSKRKCYKGCQIDVNNGLCQIK